MKNLSIILICVVLFWVVFFNQPKASWRGVLAPQEPKQVELLPVKVWKKDNFSITAKAAYKMRAVVLSVHAYWSGTPIDKLVPYDFALGWGPMSEAHVINQLKITQDGRWYNYRWKRSPPISEEKINLHSANTHIVPADEKVLQAIKKVRRFDLIELEGYLVDISSITDGGSWITSMSRSDTRGGSCEVLWVTGVKKILYKDVPPIVFSNPKTSLNKRV